MSQHRGTCLCGAVSLSLSVSDSHYGVCHCTICQRWTGSAFFGLSVAGADLTIQGAEHIRAYTSSPGWERCFCARCGSHLFCRVGAPRSDVTSYEVPIGILDNQSDLILRHELHVASAGGAFALAGDHPRYAAFPVRGGQAP